MPRPSRDHLWSTMAEALSEMAVCTRRQVGAVVVNGVPQRIVGSGYNGTPSGAPHCDPVEKGCERGLLSADACPPGGDYNAPGWRCSAIHAEHNAILDAGWERCRGGTLYVTCAPCAQCQVVIKAVGIARVVVAGKEWNGE